MADTVFDATESSLEDDAESSSERHTGADGMADVDIQALAEKVYRLMLAEIRLDRARGLAPHGGQ